MPVGLGPIILIITTRLMAAVIVRESLGLKESSLFGFHIPKVEKFGIGVPR
jgi:hypothetical protein